MKMKTARNPPDQVPERTPESVYSTAEMGVMVSENRTVRAFRVDDAGLARIGAASSAHRVDQRYRGREPLEVGARVCDEHSGLPTHSSEIGGCGAPEPGAVAVAV